ncbi:MAG: V-type ATP synthase subunit I [Methanobacterium sp.]
MFKPARMKKLKILTLDAYSNSVVSALHEEEIVQIHDISERIQQDAEWKQILKPSKATAYTGKLSSLQMKTTGIVDFLKSAERKEGGILKSIIGLINPKVPEKREVEDLGTEALIEHAESILGEVEGQTKTIENKINVLDSEKNELNSALNIATKLQNIDIDFSDLEDTNYTSAIAGKMPSAQFEEFKKEAASITDQIVILEQDAEEDTKILIVVTLKEYGSKVSSLLRRFEFELYNTSGLSGKPAAIISSAESRINEIDNEKAQLMNELADIAGKWKDDLLVLKEQLDIEKNRNEIFSFFGETNKTLMLEAWVPVKKVDKAVEIIKESSEGYSIIEVTDPEEGDDIPIHLDNPRFAKPYEMFIHMYSPPGYKEIDPTIFLALMFPFFFGFCLTDAGYGIADAIIGIVLILGLGKVNKMMRNMGIILVTGGIWAVILGTITNSFLGDLYGKFIIGNGAPFPGTIALVDAFKNPTSILIMAITTGIIYIIIGLIIGARNNIVAGKHKEALGEQISWLIIFIGIGLAAPAYLLGLSSILLYLGGALAVIGVILFIYINGPFAIMDLMGMVGNILSFARLLALGLATGGIAMTVNIFVQLVSGIPYIGIILAIGIFLVGHIGNGAFQTFGGIINALRLHYVEFFGQFYIGGSQKFRAFRTKRKITKLGGK